jgi:hypothetical protein
VTKIGLTVLWATVAGGATACATAQPRPTHSTTIIVVQQAAPAPAPAPTPAPVANAPGCVQQQHGGHAYWFCDFQRPWSDARAACRRIGTDLVVIDDADEEAFVEANGRSLLTSGLDGIYAGASDTQREGAWVWVDGTPVTYSVWREHQPDNVGAEGEGCLEFHSLGGQPFGGWNDVACSTQRPFVCESRR